MKRTISYLLTGILIGLISATLGAQPAAGVYTGTDPEDPTKVHEVKINDHYLVYTEYTNAPDFIRTRGGIFETDGASLKVDLEFNSAFEQDSVKTLNLAFEIESDKLVLKEAIPVNLTRNPSVDQDLDGTWLFATRGPDTGQERRGDSNPRKTLKFLIDGHFQWIAYHTETMRFSGTGGGIYSARDGVYTENIRYFSRDNSRVGAVLEFNYERKGDDWHHTGNNSRGEPMYEIWSIRK